MRQFGSTSPLGDGRFRLFWIGRTVSFAGDSLAFVAMPFAVLQSGGGLAGIGYVLAAGSIPRIGFMLAGGVFADRLPRRLVIITSDITQAVTYAAVAALLLTHSATLGLLIAGQAVYGVASAFFTPALAGIVAELVDPSVRQKANALLSLSRNIGGVVALGLGGLLVALAGPGTSFAIDAASFAVSVGCLAAVPMARKIRAPSRFLADLAEGWHEVLRRRWFWVNLIAHSLWNFGYAAYAVAGPVIVDRSLGGPAMWGAATASYAAGAGIGGVVSLRIKVNRPIAVGNVVLCLAALQLLALAWRAPIGVLCTAAFFGAAGGVVMNVLWDTTVQSLVPEHLLSRVDAYDWLLSLIAVPLGYAMVGPLIAAYGERAVLIGAACVVSVPELLAIALPSIRNVRRHEPDDDASVGLAPAAP
jgi:MFS family permease